jgi:hypothetical protein
VRTGSALLLSAWLTVPAQSAPAPAFQPHVAVRLQPVAPRQVVARPTDDREVICGMVVIHKTLADDLKIFVPARDTGATVRRIEPHGCGGMRTITPK